MAQYQRPGVYLQETLNPLPTGGGLTADAVACFIGASNRGPVIPTLVGDWSQFTAQFGDFTNSTYLAQAVYFYFANGGVPCYVTRVVHTDAVVATRTFQDTATTPQPTLRVDAANPGAWGNSISIDVTTGISAGRFNLVVHYPTSTTTVETFADLAMDPTDPRYAPSVINSSSQYVVATDLLSTTAAPNNAPALVTAQPLATGADGSAVAATDYLAAANLHGTIAQPQVINAPGVVDVTTVNDIISYAEAQTTAFVVVDPPQGDSVSAVLAYAGTLTVSSRAAVYYPWLVVNDPSKYTPGLTKTIPPGGAVVGQFISSDQNAGPFKTPAGTSARLNGVVKLETVLASSDYDTLNTTTPPVNAIKPLPGFGICVYGGRTLKGGYADKYIAIRRSLIYIEQSLKNLTQFAVFETNDAKLWATLSSVCSRFLSGYFARGGLRGSSTAEAYYVKCDASNNTLATIQNGQVNIEVGVALEYPAEFVVIQIGQFEGGSTVSTTL